MPRAAAMHRATLTSALLIVVGWSVAAAAFAPPNKGGT